MKVLMKTQTDFNVKKLVIEAKIRYWEDSMLNGTGDETGEMPCKKGDIWCPQIDVDDGRILNWEKGKIADINYKVCDEGIYYLMDKNDIVLCLQKCYVPSMLSINHEGFGDYIIMKIDEDGFIKDFNPDFSFFDRVITE